MVKRKREKKYSQAKLSKYKPSYHRKKVTPRILHQELLNNRWRHDKRVPGRRRRAKQISYKSTARTFITSKDKNGDYWSTDIDLIELRRLINKRLNHDSKALNFNKKKSVESINKNK